MWRSLNQTVKGELIPLSQKSFQIVRRNGALPSSFDKINIILILKPHKDVIGMSWGIEKEESVWSRVNDRLNWVKSVGPLRPFKTLRFYSEGKNGKWDWIWQAWRYKHAYPGFHFSGDTGKSKSGWTAESETVDRTLKGGTLILKGPESPCRGTSVRWM